MTPSPDQIRAALDRAMTVDITTTGRRTGEPTRIEIWMFKVGDRYIITGTPGPRDWYANVLADPRMIVHLKDGLPVDLDAVATPISDPSIRRQVLNAPNTSWYRTQTTLADLVANSPMVELEFPALDR
jgi:deazaflavin-dependent oxidoreductase (nitroreductase family)